MTYLKLWFCITSECGRLDSALGSVLGVSRSQASNLVELGLVRINKTAAKKRDKVRKYDLIEVYATRSKKPEQSVDFEIEVIYEDNNYLILNKPKNLVVHHAHSVRGPTLTDYLKSKNYSLSDMGGETRCGIVHRLDKDTSGAILIAKDNHSHAKFSDMLKRKEIGRIYVCVINKPLKQDCVVDCFIGRDPRNRLRIARLDKKKYPKARHSKTEFRKLLESVDGRFEIVGARLFTGRTHQIRVHLGVLGRYIIGDTLYGPSGDNHDTKVLLHASVLYVENRLFLAKMHKDLVEFMGLRFGDYKRTIQSKLELWQGEFTDKKVNEGLIVGKLF